MGFRMKLTGAKCAYPLVAPNCTRTLASISPQYQWQQIMYLTVGVGLVLIIATKLYSLRQRQKRHSTQHSIMLLLLGASVLVALRSIDPEALDDVLPYVVSIAVSDACTSFIETAIIVILMFWIRLMEGDHQEYSRRLLLLGGLSIGITWIANLVFPVLQWYYWDTNTHFIEQAKITVALLTTFFMTVAVSIYGWKIHRRLESIQDSASFSHELPDLEHNEFDYEGKSISLPVSPVLPPPTRSPSRIYQGACCMRSKMLETLVGLHLVAGGVFVLQVYTVFHVPNQNKSLVECMTAGCEEANMKLPILAFAQMLSICTGIWIFRHV